MVQRRFPRPAELRELLRPAPFQLNPTDRRLSRAVTISDLRQLARRRAPRAVFDYTDGGADVGELALRRCRETFRRVEFRPTVLQDVSKIRTETTILGRISAQPFVFAPTGFTRMMHAEGERAVAAVAEQAGIPYALSTMGTTTIEDVAAAAPGADKWFQLYLWRDRVATRELIDRAAAAGYTTLVLTVDAPVSGARLRDRHNGLTIPPQLTARTFLDGALHPRWWMDLLTTEPLTFANLASPGDSVADLIDRVLDPGVTMADLEWVRETWPGTLVVKGVLSVADAQRVVAAGGEAIVLSNHGGRQLDRAPAPLELLRPVRDALDDKVEILMDSGVTTGGDIVAAMALGASGVLVGRAYLYGLMAGGRRGVARAVEILSEEITRTLALLGVDDISAVGAEHVTIRSIGSESVNGSPARHEAGVAR